MSTLLEPHPSTPPVLGAPIEHLPGGALVTETWSSPERVTVSICGEIDAYDRHPIVDLLTACILEGARHIAIDAQAVSFADVSSRRAFDQIGRYMARVQGSIDVIGLEPLWQTITRNRPAPIGRGAQVGGGR